MSGRITTPTRASAAGAAKAAATCVPSGTVSVRVPRSATSPVRGGAGGRLSWSWHMPTVLPPVPGARAPGPSPGDVRMRACSPWLSRLRSPRYGPIVAVDLYAGIPVGDYDRALAWYERLLGSAPSFLPNATEAVWELAEHRSVFIEVRPAHAGHAMHTIIVDDLDALIREIADRGIQPAERETYSNGVRKVTYRDPDGNEIGFGGIPARPSGAE